MAQPAARSRDLFGEAAGRRGFTPVGHELTRAARTLHDALARMETAVARQIDAEPSKSAPDPELLGAYQQMEEHNTLLLGEKDRYISENRRLLEESQTLEQMLEESEKDRARIAGELKTMEGRNAEVSTQVKALSERLDALIGRLAELLEEG